MVRRGRRGLAISLRNPEPGPPPTIGFTPLELGVLADRADAFVDKIAFNFHMDYPVYQDNHASVIMPSVIEMGLRSARVTSLGSGNDLAIGNTKELFTAAGVKFLMLTKKGSTYTDMSAQDYMMARIPPESVWVYTGPNELDNDSDNWGGVSGSPPAFISNGGLFEGALKAWRDGSADPIIRATPISSPSFSGTTGKDISAANYSALVDYGDIHPYPWGPHPVEPGAGLAAKIAATGNVYGGIGAKPIIASETAWPTAPDAITPSYLVGQGISEAAQQKYLPRLFSEYDLQGIKFIGAYEWMDEDDDPTNGEMNFGVIRNDGSKKPAFDSLKNDIALMREREIIPESFVLGTAYLTENFNVPDQNGWPNMVGTDTAKAWVGGSSSETNHFDVVSHKGQSKAAGSAWHGVGDLHSGQHYGAMQFDTIVAGFDQTLKLHLRYHDGANNYALEMYPSTGQIVLSRVVGGSSSSIAFLTKAGLDAVTELVLKLWVVVKGNDNYLYGKAYDPNDGEPEVFDITGVDVGGNSTVLTNGQIGCWLDDNSSGSRINVSSVVSAPFTYTAASMPALSPFTPGHLNYSLTDVSGVVQRKLYQKADGTFLLRLWQRVSSWNYTTKTDIVNAAVPVTVTLLSGGPKTGNLFTPSGGLTPTALGSHSSFTFNVPDEVVILELA